MRGLIVLLLAAASAAPALETPLILTPQGTPVINTELLLQINPGMGLMNYYQSTNQQLLLQTGSSFLFDLEMYESTLLPVKGSGGVAWNALRMGSVTVAPNAEQLLAQFGKEPLKDFPDLPSPQAAALKAEDAFWSKPHQYDGIVRGAWNLDYLMLVIPSKHVLMLYSTDNQKIKLVAWMNYGPVEMVLTGYNTNPSPQQLFNGLPGFYQTKAHKAELRREKKLLRTKETPKSDAWVGVGLNNVFVVNDLANGVIFTVAWTGKSLQLQSVRQIEVDLSLPPGRSFNSQPDGAQVLQNFTRQNLKPLNDAQLPTDTYLQRAYVAFHVHGSGGPGLQANCLNDKVVLDFTDRKKLLTYSLTATSFDLISARDYTDDNIVDILSDQAQRVTQAFAAFKQAHAIAKASPHYAMAQLKYALENYPYLLPKITADKRLIDDLKSDADWTEMLDKAIKDTQKADDEKIEIAKKAKELKAYDDKIAQGIDPEPDTSTDDQDQAAPAPTPAPAPAPQGAGQDAAPNGR